MKTCCGYCRHYIFTSLFLSCGYPDKTKIEYKDRKSVFEVDRNYNGNCKYFEASRYGEMAMLVDKMEESGVI